MNYASNLREFEPICPCFKDQPDQKTDHGEVHAVNEYVASICASKFLAANS